MGMWSDGMSKVCRKGWGLLAGAGALLAVATAPALAVEGAHFEALDVFELEYATEPAISPDGDSVVYVRNSNDIMTDKVRKNLWLLNLESNSHKPLLSGRDNYSSPVWSPDGDRLAYLSNEEGSTQLYVRWMKSGETALISQLPKTPKAMRWSPDGRWLAFLMFVPVDDTPLASMPPKPKGAEWSAEVKQIDSLVYRSDGSGYLEKGSKQVFVIPAEGGTPRQLTSGYFDHDGPLSWSADGQHVFFSTNRDPEWEYQPQESDIYSISILSGELKQLTRRVGPDEAAVISPDGRYLAYVGHDQRMTGYNNNRVYVLELKSGESTLVSGDFDRDIGSLRWSADGRRIWFSYEDEGTLRLGFATRQGELSETSIRLGGTTLGRPYASGAFDVGPHDKVVYTHADPLKPADLALGVPSKTVQALTALNEDLLGHKQLGKVEALKWQSSHDGQEIEGWLVTPPDFDATKKYPFILEIHGGPHAAYGPNFSAEVQLYAAAGYVVLYANPRGSTSYGDDFANAIHLAYPGYDYDDLMSGVDAVLAKGFVDETQLFVTGGSGGGVLTAWIVGKTDRFAAAVVAKPVINWVSFALTADYALYFSKFWFDGPAWEKTEDYWARSPLSLVGNVTTPTMLLTGEADYRTPISESEQYYQALKQRQVDTMMIRVPGSPHGIAARPSRLIAKVNNILAWFERYRVKTN